MTGSDEADAIADSKNASVQVIGLTGAIAFRRALASMVIPGLRLRMNLPSQFRCQAD